MEVFVFFFCLWKKSKPFPDVISSHFLSHWSVCCYPFFFCKSLSFAILQMIKAHVLSLKAFTLFKTDWNLPICYTCFFNPAVEIQTVSPLEPFEVTPFQGALDEEVILFC